MIHGCSKKYVTRLMFSLVEKALASLEGNGGRSTFRLRKLGDSEESNLHTFEHTYYAHKDQENNYCNSWWNSFPHGGFVGEKSFHGYCDTECKDCKGHEDTSPEEDKIKSSLRSFLGFYWLSCCKSNKDLYQVRCVKKSGEFDCHCYPKSEYCEVVVNVVKHTVRCVNLGVHLSDHIINGNLNCEEKNSQLISNSLWNSYLIILIHEGK